MLKQNSESQTTGRFAVTHSRNLEKIPKDSPAIAIAVLS